jgi:hypothetical protein
LWDFLIYFRGAGSVPENVATTEAIVEVFVRLLSQTNADIQVNAATSLAALMNNAGITTKFSLF